jgi:hypothetical protein
MALSLRSVALAFAGRMPDSVRATEQAVEHAREAGDAVLATALIMQAQAHLAAGDLPAAARSLDVGSELITRTDLAMAWKRFTVQGDLAAAEGRPADALALYSRSLREAERRGNDSQIVLDLVGVAAALGAVHADAGAVEVEAMARALLGEIGGASGSQVHLLDRSDVERARERLGTDAVGSAQRGRTVEPALRVTRACELVDEAVAARGAGTVSPAAG